MPMYTFRCEDCGRVEDLLMPAAKRNEAHACPACGGRVVRVWSPAYFRFRKRYLPTMDGWKRSDM